MWLILISLDLSPPYLSSAFVHSFRIVVIIVTVQHIRFALQTCENFFGSTWKMGFMCTSNRWVCVCVCVFKSMQNSIHFVCVRFRLFWHCSLLICGCGDRRSAIRIYGAVTGLIGVLKSILHNSPSPLHKRICCDRSSLFRIFPRIRRILGSIQPFYK